MVVRYGIVAEVTGPSLRNSGSGIPGPEFWSKLILPWKDLIPMCVPPESGNSAENPEFRKMRTGINRNTGRNAQPRPWVGSGEPGEAGKTPGGGSRAARRRARPVAATVGVSGPGRRRAHDARHRDRGGRRRRRWATAAQWAAGRQGGRGRREMGSVHLIFLILMREIFHILQEFINRSGNQKR